MAPYHIYTLSVRRSATQTWSRKILGLTLLSGVFLAFHFFFWISSLQRTTVASSVTLVSTTPLFVALFSLLCLKERPHSRLWTGIACTVLGSAIVAGVDVALNRDAFVGDVLALLGATMAAGYFIAGRSVRRHLGLQDYIVAVYGTAAFVLLACCLVSGVPLLGFSRRTYLVLLLLALVPQLIGHTSFNWALKFLSATVVAVLTLGEPIGAALLAYVFLGETVSFAKGFGLLLLGTGILWAATGNGRQLKDQPTRAVYDE
jgi:drug/metabolite transporter (DMT)-like permease